MERFAIIGFGCSGYHALSAIREAGCTAQIDIYSDTDMPPYNPMLTTYYVAGKLPFGGMFPFGTLEEIGRQFQADFHTKVRVNEIKAEEKAVITSDGEKRTYDKILVSTGARAFVPGSFASFKDAHCMRTVEDACRLREALNKRPYKNA